ncbi:MAG: OmpA family protein [Rubrivivax sp.]|nr:OmpA family protein [Rubrivivax sp.]
MSSATVPTGVQVSAASTTRTIRLVREREGSPSVLWLALLPAAGFAALTWFGTGPFAVNEVEATVAREVRSQLQGKGLGWVNVAVGGQDVLLSGDPPTPGAGEAALQVARTATCPTWAGPQVCAVTVLGAFGAPAVAATPTLPAAPAMPAPPGAPSTGAGPSTVAPPVAAVAPPPSAAVAACDAAFADLLSTSRIEFASGGSAIDARSGALLDRLAAAARGCPGKVQIEGHTDNVGDPAGNQRLSAARAAAVRDALVQRGMPAERLLTVGHGDAQPLADNADPAGRATNRRINFKAVP